ncbi:MAG: DNA-binding domain-containing protein, partial [Anabaena sp. CRKS33]
NPVELTGRSKTDVVVSAISQYLGCADNVPLNQRVGELEIRVRELESLDKKK